MKYSLKKIWRCLYSLKNAYYVLGIDKTEVEYKEDIVNLKRLLWLAYQEAVDEGLDPTSLINQWNTEEGENEQGT